MKMMMMMIICNSVKMRLDERVMPSDSAKERMRLVKIMHACGDDDDDDADDDDDDVDDGNCGDSGYSSDKKSRPDTADET